MGEHRFVLQSERDVTCTEDGVKTHVCSVCGETKTEIVHSTGHVFGEINVSKYPGCSIAGEGFRICSRCGAGENVVIPPLGHRRSGDDFRFVGDDHVEFFCQNCGETVVEPLANVNDKEILKAAAKIRKKDKKISKKKLAVIISVVSVILVLALVIAGVFDTASKEPDRQVSATAPDEDAVYVNATPKPQETTKAQENLTEQTTLQPPEATERATEQTERKALYYVTLSGNKIVLLNEPLGGEKADVVARFIVFFPVKTGQEG